VTPARGAGRTGVRAGVRTRVVLVAARARNGVIGRDGGIPWRIPPDFAHFKRVTVGHPLVLGRTTFEGIGKPEQLLGNLAGFWSRRIDDANRRILTKKFELGLFEHPMTDRTRIRRLPEKARTDVVDLHPGDALVLYTDGITEARDPAGAQFDEPGVAQALAARGDRDPEADRIADGLVRAAQVHTQGSNVDDVAVVVVRVDPVA